MVVQASHTPDLATSTFHYHMAALPEDVHSDCQSLSIPLAAAMVSSAVDHHPQMRRWLFERGVFNVTLMYAKYTSGTAASPPQ
jgi:hypothetical protein